MLFLQIVKNFVLHVHILLAKLLIRFLMTTPLLHVLHKKKTIAILLLLENLNFDTRDSSIYTMYSIEDKLFVSFPSPVNDCKC